MNETLLNFNKYFNKQDSQSFFGRYLNETHSRLMEVMMDMNQDKKKTYGMTSDFSCSGDMVFTELRVKDNCLQVVYTSIAFFLICIFFEYVLNYKTNKIQEYKYSKESTIKDKLFLTFIHFLHTLLAYILMMGIMTYNIWLIFAIVISNGIGYYIFADFNRKIETNGCCNFN